eukprot:CAMPEP_0177408502 /NCGR_PEP_ID=MMETSP0368-20130122/63716_1 /TAXON_ID=447022 ORGANISM="Scrippsiella hangoei-like, Strain SHHI-4" /NCGR_SAMPLE_ID=MMETSP0368 /ASSEMBLY_ACC=CAM_ASM_000363 /LENGTH=36 /DNA_ID= /DNA_START= /DNA_END= /DNA_ORIENTATION=
MTSLLALGTAPQSEGENAVEATAGVAPAAAAAAAAA